MDIQQVREQIVRIQSYAVQASNTSAMQYAAAFSTSIGQLNASKIFEYIQNSTLVTAVYDNLLDQIDQMLNGKLPITEYSVVVLLAFVVGQLISIKAFGRQQAGASIESAEAEVRSLVTYLTQYTGEEVLPRF